jgi:hypothetical protein
MAGDILLQLRDSIDNWPLFQNSSDLKGWDNASPVCNWSGVICSSDNRVVQLCAPLSLLPQVLNHYQASHVFRDFIAKHADIN